MSEDNLARIYKEQGLMAPHAIGEKMIYDAAELRKSFKERVKQTRERLKPPCNRCHLWVMNWDCEGEECFCEDCRTEKGMSKVNIQYNTSLIGAFWNTKFSKKLKKEAGKQ